MSQYHEDYMKPAQYHIDYDEYTKLCVSLGVKPQLPVKEGKNFYEHYNELLTKPKKKK